MPWNLRYQYAMARAPLIVTAGKHDFPPSVSNSRESRGIYNLYITYHTRFYANCNCGVVGNPSVAQCAL